MTILQACCCWKSVRQGSVACGVYTGIYYALNAAHSIYLLHEEIRFLKNATYPSMIDHQLTSETSGVFSALVFAFSICGIISTILLFYGIYKDIKYLLIPWIFNMIFFTIIDIAYIIHGLLVHALQWNPSVALLITVDFFLNTLNFYATLCVLSQYQEYQAGRGQALKMDTPQHSTVSAQFKEPSASCCTSHNHLKPSIYPENDGVSISPSHQALTSNKPKKSVKFGANDHEIVPWESEKQNTGRGIDTVPLIDTVAITGGGG